MKIEKEKEKIRPTDKFGKPMIRLVVENGEAERETEKAVPVTITSTSSAKPVKNLWFPKSQIAWKDGLLFVSEYILNAKEAEIGMRLLAL